MMEKCKTCSWWYEKQEKWPNYDQRLRVDFRHCQGPHVMADDWVEPEWDLGAAGQVTGCDYYASVNDYVTGAEYGCVHHAPIGDREIRKTLEADWDDIEAGKREAEEHRQAQDLRYQERLARGEKPLGLTLMSTAVQSLFEPAIRRSLEEPAPDIFQKLAERGDAVRYTKMEGPKCEK